MGEQAFIETYCRIIDMGAFSMISLKEKTELRLCVFERKGLLGI